MLRSFLAKSLRVLPLVLAMVGGIGVVGTAPAYADGVCGCACSGPGGASAPGGSRCSTDLDCTHTSCRTYCAAYGAFTPGVSADGRRVYSCVGGVSIDGGLTTEEQERIDRQVAPTTQPRNVTGGTTPPSGGAAPAARGSCAFSCGSETDAPRTAMVIVPCSTDQDCASACTTRCPVPGLGQTDPQGRPTNGLPDTATGLVCSLRPNPPRCVITPGAAGGTTTGSSTGSGDGSGGLRFVLPSCTQNGNCSLTDIINTGVRAANFLLALSGLVFLATVLWAGAQLIFFAQDAKSISKAQAMLTSASIAMIIIMVAGVAVRFVSSSLEVTPSLLQTPGTASGSRSTTPPPATPATPTPTR